MSAQDAPSAAEIITIVSTSFTLNYIEFPVITFLAYEYLITLDQEIKLFWKRGFTGASALFLFVRYSTLICYDILGAISFARLSDDVRALHVPSKRSWPDTPSCALIIKAQAGFSIFQYFPWAAFSALRVLALSGMNRPLAALVFLLASAPAAANFTQYGFKLTGVNTPLAGCQGQIDATQQQVEIRAFVVVSRVGLILADIIGVAVTVAKTRQGAKAPHLGGSQRSLGNVLLYDGLIYFAALLCFNVLDLALSVIAFVTPINSGSYVTALTDPYVLAALYTLIHTLKGLGTLSASLTAVLVCRFLLDLQAANVSSMNDSHAFESVDHHTAGVGSLVFARVIGSMGAPLGPDHTTTDSTLDQSDDEVCGVSLSSLRPAASLHPIAVDGTRDIEEVPASG
ncbi:uncharacterized protein TRAVEDRAFT_47235 [Trametes versicolor FP-101664 SS1]|uniref:uncharacterized protein n=1 Tax=Trametes versicolor (strain FP-101664) TaxID=717944 RepID=UPI00046234BD|nr:uncharacterized protein TRAVEDRAFT_47235 [Trametes versicolor FP-101664 SS1]EIW59938.1 hypothetical protein TRAVEDRAFT_47235 [Trametes versicolor FP-101664 SS1]